jgi:hypothetical protein
VAEGDLWSHEERSPGTHFPREAKAVLGPEGDILALAVYDSDSGVWNDIGLPHWQAEALRDALDQWLRERPASV